MADIYSNNNHPFFNVEIAQHDYGPFALGTTTAVSAAVDITIGLLTSLTITTQPDGCRRITVTKTDANSSVTAFVVRIVGKDRWKRVVEETLTFDAGNQTKTSSYAYSELTTVKTDATGTAAAGVDQVSIGTADAIGLPFQLQPTGSSDQVWYKTVDNAADAGTIDVAYSVWVLGTAPDAARRYRVSGRSTLGEEV